jgi:sirohydrochlorin ferrochelatase
VTRAVLLAHGSPDPRSAAAVRAAAAALDGRPGLDVTTAYLDHDEPRLADAVGDGAAVVLPLLLSTAYHATVDVPAAAEPLGPRVRLLAPLDHPADVLDALLVRAGSPVVVVSAGTRDDAERRAFSDAVAAGAWRTGVRAVAAFATGPGPRVGDVAGPGGASVLPWLLAPGRLRDAVVAAAGAASLEVAAGPLLEEPLLLEAIARRLAAALPVARREPAPTTSRPAVVSASAQGGHTSMTRGAATVADVRPPRSEPACATPTGPPTIATRC